MCPSLSSVSHLLCLWEERDSWGACPSFAITERNGQSHVHQGHKPLQGCTGQASAGEGSGREKKALSAGQFHLSQKLKSPVWPGAGLVAPGPPKCCMNHFKGKGMTAPAPVLLLDSGHVLQPRRLLSLLTPKCFISLA